MNLPQCGRRGCTDLLCQPGHLWQGLRDVERDPDTGDVIRNLSTYSVEALVDAVIRLTHMVATPSNTNAQSTDYRARRDLARAELIRRCG